MSDTLRPAINLLHEHIHDSQADVSEIYDRTGHLAELVAAVMSLTGRTAAGAGRLPGAAEGLRIDGDGDLLSPDDVRRSAVDALEAAGAHLDAAGRSLNEAVQTLSRIYIADGSIADQLRPSTD